jgi:F-type H+-transporting ATPase subunit b
MQMNFALLSAAAGEHAQSPFDATLVAAIAFVIFVGALIYLKIPAVIAKGLDEQSAAIAKELEQAKALRQQAEELRLSYQNQQAEAEANAKALIAQAEIDAKDLKERAQVQLEADIAAKAKAASERIARAELAAIDEVRTHAANAAVGMAQDMIAAGTSGKGAEKLFDASLKNVADTIAKAS